MAKYFEVQRQWPELYGNFKFDTVKELLLAGVSEKNFCSKKIQVLLV